MSKICALFLPFLFISCATITRGVHDKLYVQSEPAGAAVQLSTGERGVTPAKFVRSRRESLNVTVSKPGYVTQTVRVESKVSATGGTAMIGGNLVAGGVVGIGVDAATGAMLGLYPNPVVVHLVPAPVSKSSKKISVSSRKSASKKTNRSSSSKTKPSAKPPPATEELPPIKSTPQSTPPPPPQNSPTPYSPPPVLESVPDKSPSP
jgi:PEGA domain